MPLALQSLSSPSVQVSTTELEGKTVLLADVANQEDAAFTAKDGYALAGAIKHAQEQKIPFVSLLNFSGVTLEEGGEAAHGWALAAKELSLASGVIPTVLVVCGPVVSGVSLLLGLSDIVLFTEEAYAFITGPTVVEAYTGMSIDAETLGGAGTHARFSGLASMIVAGKQGALDVAGSILQYLPNNVNELPSRLPTGDPLDRLTPEAGEQLPDSATGSYDVRKVIESICDDGDFLELKASWAPNMVTGFATLGSRPIGIVANQTQALAGSIDIPASQKGARFVAMCDAFNVPLLTLVDTSGFLPGKDLEWRGMIRHGAQLAFAYARATVPRLGLILRKSYGGAYIVMDSRFMGNDMMFAWPSAEVAVMGAKGAVGILHRKASAEEQEQLVKDYEEKLLTPYPAAERGSISSVITPEDTRKELSAALELLISKKEKLRPRKHDNGPL